MSQVVPVVSSEPSVPIVGVVAAASTGYPTVVHGGLSTQTDHITSSMLAHEQVLTTIQECFMYKIPPLQRSKGHSCQEWGLENPMWTGRLNVVAVQDEVFIAF